jgi:predicted nucleotide-binding protein
MSKQSKKLEELANEGRILLYESDPYDADRKFESWDSTVASWLDEEHPGTGLSAEWSSLGHSSMVFGSSYYDSPQVWQAFRNGVQKRMEWLSRLPTKLNNMDRKNEEELNRNALGSDKVFVVHGQDEAAKHKVARFLEKLRLRPIILNEQLNKGRTIIEKFEEYSDVSFAIVLLTPDDIGGLAVTEEPQKPRARQNVILELGYFLGRLDRKRVAALFQGNIELPSNFLGVLYIQFDPGDAWKLPLAKEMKAAGLPIDLNDAS